MSEEQPRGFGRAVKKAAELINQKQEITSLLDRAGEKAAQKKKILGEAWQDLKLLFDLIRDWKSGNYKGISVANILIVIGAVIYFVNPLDVIPDFIIGFGFLDDITVIGHVISSLKKEIQSYREWSNSSASEDADSE